MSFQGSLAELALPDVIQLVSSSGKTGCFHLTDGTVKGQIYILEGRIVHAQVEDLSGEEAVYQLAIWSRGEFFFETGATMAANTITKTNTNLLMEAARRLDEWRVLQRKVPSMDLIPEFVIPEGREGQINLNTSEWLILSKIDGRRSIKAIANASGNSDWNARLTAAPAGDLAGSCRFAGDCPEPLASARTSSALLAKTLEHSAAVGSVTAVREKATPGDPT